MRLNVSLLTLYFNYLTIFRFHLVSSKYLLPKIKSSFIIENEKDITEKFFADFSKAYLSVNEINHVTVVGESNNDLKKVHRFYRDSSYSFCKKGGEKCVDPSVNFNSRSAIIFFLNDLGEDTFNENFKFVTGCHSKCKFIFVLTGKAEFDEISSFFTITIKQALISVDFILIGEDSVRFYNRVPTDNCSIGLELKFVWKAGFHLKNSYFEPLLIYDFSGCPFDVSTLEYLPKMKIEKDENGTRKITGGRDGLLVLLIAEKLNFKINVKQPPKYGEIHSSRKLGILDDVILGNAEFGVGRLRHLPGYEDKLYFSDWHDHECITWGVPLLKTGLSNVFWDEYSPKVWYLIGLVFLLSCLIGYALYKSSGWRNGDRRNAGLMAIILDIVALHLGNPATHFPLFTSGKMILVAYLIYGTVITTGYKTSLNSALTTVRNTPAISDTRGIIKANLTTGGSFYHYQILANQVNASEVNRELINRYVIYNEDSKSFHRLKYHRDFALLDRKVDLNYERSSSSDRTNDFHTLHECVLKYYIVMVLKKGSFLLHTINRIIRRVIESGIQQVWESHETVRGDKYPERLHAEYTRRILISFFKFYCFALAVCTLVFFIELLVPKLKAKKKPYVASFAAGT